MIYLFDKLETLVKIADESLLVSWTHTVEINQFERASFELPADYSLTGIKYFGFFDDQGVFKLFRITQKVVDDTLYVEGMDKAESDLRHIGIIQDKRPQNVTADQALTVALENTGYQVGTVSGLPTVLSTNFYYISPVEALTKIIEKWGCEFRVRYTFVQNKITSRYIDLAKRFGKVSGKQFVYGDQALSIIREESEDEVVTALIGRGKGEELDSGGYGRRIEFKDIVWQTSKGNPVNKPKGQNYLLMESARGNYGLSQDGSMKHRWAVWIADQIEDPTELITATWEQLQKLSVPLTVFKASLVDMDGQASYGDTVAVIRDEVGIAFSARIFKLTTDKLNANRSSVELGDYEVLKYHQRSGDRVSQAAEQLREEQSLYAKELTEFYKRIEEKLATKQVEIEEDLRVARQEFETAQAQAEEEAKVFQETIQAEADALKKEGESLKKSLQKEAEQRTNQAEEIRTEAREAVKKAREDAEAWQVSIAEEIGEVQSRASALQSDISKADQKAAEALSRANTAATSARSATTIANQAKTAAANAGSAALAKAEEAKSDVATLSGDLRTTAKKLEQLKIGGRNLFIENSSVPGYLNATSRVSPQNVAVREVTSDFIAVKPNEELVFQVWATIDNNQPWRTWAFYDEKHSPIGSRVTPSGIYNAISGPQHLQNTIVVPEGTSYIRVSARLYEDGKIKVERGNTPTDWTPAPEDLDVKFDTFTESISGDISTLEGRYDDFEEEWGRNKQSYGQLFKTVNGEGETLGLSQRTAELEKGLNGVSERFENIRVGAVNYIRNSDFSSKSEYWQEYQSERFGLNFNYQHSVDSRQQTGAHFWYHGTDTSRWYGIQQRFAFVGNRDEEITLSLYAAKDGNVSGLRVALHFIKDNAIVGQSWEIIPNNQLGRDYKRFTFLFKLPSDVDKLTLLLFGEDGKTSNLYVTKVQLERGNVATDWHPSEEDFRHEMATYIRDSSQNFSELKKTVEGADGEGGLVSTINQIKQTADGTKETLMQTKTDLLEQIETAQTEISKFAGQLETKLTSTQVKSILNEDGYKTGSDIIGDIEKKGYLTDSALQGLAKSSDLDNYLTTTTFQNYEKSSSEELTRELTKVVGLIPTSFGGRNLFIKKDGFDGYLNVSGTVSPQGAIVNEVTSDFIEVQVGEVLQFQLWVTLPANGQAWTAWRFYNNQRRPIGARSIGQNARLTTSGSRHEHSVLVVPQNARYVRVSARMYNDGKIKLERGSLPSDWSPAPEDFVTSVDFNKVRETAQLYERIIGNEEDGIKTNLAQHVMTSELWQTEIRDASWDTRNYLRDGTFSQEWLHWVDNRRQSGLNVDFTHSSGNRKQKGVHLWGSSNNIYKGIEQSVFFTRFAGEKITLSALISRDGSPESSVRLGVHFIKDGEILAQQWKWLSPSEIKRGIYGRHSWTIILPVDVDSLKIMFQFEEGKEANYYFTEASLNISDRFIGYSDSVEEAQAVATQVTQLSDNWAVKTLTDSGTVLSQLNLNSGGVKIEGKLIHLNGKTLIDEGVIKSAMIESLSADKIKTGYLDSSLIKAGSIDADHIKSGIISADKLAVGLGGNLLYNPIFSNPTDGLPNGWRKWSNSSALNPNFNNTTNEVKKWALQSYLPSEYMLRFECNGTEKATMTCASSTIPVNPNAYYGGSVYLAVHRGKTKMVLRFNKSDGTYVDRDSEWVTTQYSMSNGLTDAKRVFLKAQAPSDAVSVQLIIWLNGIDNQNNKIAFAARPMLEECTEHTTAPSAWQNAGVTSIHGGSIVTNTLLASKLIIDEGFINKLVTDDLWAEKLFAESAVIEKLKAVELDAGQIKSGKIKANLIDSDVIETKHLKSDAITAEKIASNAITAEKIKTGAISASHISTTGLTADLITSGVLRARNGTTLFNLDDGMLNFLNNNTGIRRMQADAASQGLYFQNTTVNINGTNRILSQAILGAERRGDDINNKWNEGGFNGIITETIRDIESSADDRADRVTVIGDRIRFLHTFESENSEWHGKNTGWEMKTYTPLPESATSPDPWSVVLQPANIRKDRSVIYTGQLKICFANGTVVKLEDIIKRLLHNTQELTNRSGGSKNNIFWSYDKLINNQKGG